MKRIITPLLLILVLSATAQIPSGYYEGTNGLTGEELKQKLHQISRGHKVRTYAEFRDVILPHLDEDPANANNILLFYKNESIPKSHFASANQDDYWNREHTWPKSHGFPAESDTAYTDVHNLRPADVTVNESKSNKDFNDVPHIAANEEGEAPDTYTTEQFFDPRPEIKGDIARILFYMDTRYESKRLDLELVDRRSYNGDPELGVLYTLLKWHEQDPVDPTERARHEGAYSYQENRNPFIDNPKWVAEIYGSTTSARLVVDEVNFNADFGQVALGSSLTQLYTLRAYNLTTDVSVAVQAPFALSADGANFSLSLMLPVGTVSPQSYKVHLRYTPVTQAETVAATVTHTTTGASASFEIKGREGTTQLLSIAEARQRPIGEVVNVTGIVINNNNNVPDNKAIYDGSAGIVVRGFAAGHKSADLLPGDSVVVSGPLNVYNNLLQIDGNPVTLEVVAQGKPLPKPQVLRISQIGEQHESEPVVLRGVTFEDGGEKSFAHGNFTIKDQTGAMLLRIGGKEHPLIGQPVPTGIFEITGFVGQFGKDYQFYVDSESAIIASTLTLGSDKLIEVPAMIYPNPSTQRQVVLHLPASLGHFPVRASLFSIDGRQLQDKLIEQPFLELGELPKGIYLLVITSKSRSGYSRLVVE